MPRHTSRLRESGATTGVKRKGRSKRTKSGSRKAERGGWEQYNN